MEHNNINMSLKILDSKSKKFLVTLAIGNKIFKTWKKYSKPSWIEYCKKNNLGLIVITKDLIEKKKYFLEKSNLAEDAYWRFFKKKVS